MKIKHFSGYGTINAKKEFSNEKNLVVHVWGLHEIGLERDDKYDVFNWLVKKFDKKRKDYFEISEVTIRDYYEDNGKDSYPTEHCLYHIRFR